jgi:WD40 repeat protein
VPPAENEDTGHHRIEIIHESLLTAWPRLVRWQSQDADSALLRDELRQAAQMWEQHDRADDLLWIGTAFEEFRLWRQRYPGGLTATEEAFAQAMTTHAARRKRRRRMVVTGAFAILLAVVGAIGTMWRQSETARREEERARREAVAAQLLSLGRLQLEEFPSEALAYALASLEEADSEAARLLALEALWQGPTALVLKPAEFDGINRLRPSPDGRWLVTLGMQNGAVLWSRGGGPPKILQGGDPEGGLAFGAWSPDSKIFITKHYKSTAVRLWSIPEGKEIHSWDLDGVNEETRLLLRGDRLLELTTIDSPSSTTSHGIERVRSWPLEGGEPEALGRWDARQVMSSDIDPDGHWVAYADGEVVALHRLDALENSPPRLVGRHPDEKVGVRFHPRGGRLASGSESGEVRLWSVDGEGERPLRTLRGEGSTRNLAIDPKDRWLAAGNSGPIRAPHAALLWNLENPPDAQPIPLGDFHYGWNWQMAFDPEGRWLLFPQWNHTVFWALSDRYPRVLRGQEPPYISVAFAPDGGFLASASDDLTVRLWPLALEAGEEVRILHHERTARTLRNIEWSPTGDHLLVTNYLEGRVVVLPRGPGESRVLGPPLTVPSASVGSATFDLDGRRVAAAFQQMGPGGPREIRIWDLASGEEQAFNPQVEGEECPHPLLGDGYVDQMHFLPDGRLLTAGTSGVRVWDLEKASSTRLIECRKLGFFGLAPVGNGGEFLVFLIYVAGSGGKPTDQPTELFLLDPEEGSTRPITSHGTRLRAIAVDPSGALAVTGDQDGVVRVGALSGDQPHLLLGHERDIWDLEVSPDGRWIASASQDGTIRLWPMPDMDKPPFHTLPHEELLAKLRSLTNLGVVEDQGSATGYRIDVGPFPGWEEVPTW